MPFPTKHALKCYSHLTFNITVSYFIDFEILPSTPMGTLVFSNICEYPK